MTTGWFVIPFYGGRHVIPVCDTIIHTIPICRCRPVLRSGHKRGMPWQPNVYSHNSIDGREKREGKK